ncbi:tigger transposable element-derived protein 4-like [Haliotis rubra]|uniref:tigger transposable element-derived protein 4-like n=1 Tax=Haliotis rubra TaxID=36100 RepID=UPI001EE5B464|nr:tigger transposable element-derived protein 4-like [Haliotis rubra]XP_046582653.1 tigger transposable element-derived protein 4-like [Haliotis rubra]
MDQGVINKLKVHYRNAALDRYIEAINDSKQCVITVLDAMRMLRHAWQKVKPVTISNCYRHAGFVLTEAASPDAPCESDDEDDIPLARLLPGDVTLADYVSVDDNIETCAPSSDADIIESLLGPRTCHNDDSSDDEDETHPAVKPPPSVSEAIKFCEGLEEFLESVPGTNNEHFSHLASVREFVDKCKGNSQKQTLMSDFFQK